MKWSEIKKQNPSKFVLIRDVEEERLSDNSFRVIGGEIIMVSDNPKEIFASYRKHKDRGENVLYSLPTTTDNFIVEEEAFLGILR